MQAARHPLFLGITLVMVATHVAAASGSNQPVYKWIDAQGGVHYGDAVPPQYAEQDKSLINAQGVIVGTIPGKRTPEQLEAEAAKRRTEDAARQVILKNRQRDQNLLSTYLSVQEIEALRDRRADLLEAQARVTIQYREQVHVRQQQLERELARFKPYNKAPSAQQPPLAVLENLTHTIDDSAAQDRNLTIKHEELEQLKTLFASDIARFKELKP
jgi:hypothetical protein